MRFCKTCDIYFSDDIPLTVIINNHVSLQHQVLIDAPKTTKLDIAKFFNHYLVEPSIWAISAYGIALGLIATYLWGFFTLKEYTLAGVGFFLSPNQIQSLNLWYDAYPYSLMIFGSYLLLLYLKFRPLGKGYLALPIFLITYATWDFLGIGVNIVTGYSIIWLGITVISFIYYIPVRKQFSINISFLGLALFYGVGVLNLQDIFLHYWPLLDLVLNGYQIGKPFNGITNELTFCILCLLSIKLKEKLK